MLEIGVNSDRFYDMSAREMTAELKAYNVRKREELMGIYTQAMLIRAGIASLLSDKNKMPKPEELWPGIEGSSQPAMTADIESDMVFDVIMKAREKGR